MRIRIAGLFLLVFAALLSGRSALGDEAGRTFEWSDEILDIASRIPVQDDGRVKPLSTWARFAVLKAAKSSHVNTAREGDDVESLTPMEWLLDCLLFPRVAESYPVFIVEDSEVLTDIGLDAVVRKKRDRYSYLEIAPGADRLIEKAIAYSKIDGKKRSPVQGMTIDLANNFVRIERLLHSLDFAESPEAIHRSVSLALFPPPGTKEDAKEWLTPASLAAAAAKGRGALDAQIQLLGILGDLVIVRRDPVRLEERIAEFQGGVKTLARARGEYGSVPLEVAYYDWNLLTWSLILFLLGFVTLAVSWLRPAGVWLYRGSAGVITAGVLLTTAAIVLRCVIRARPPVTTLYESILFITATGVAIALAIEWMNRRRIAVVLAAVLGFGGLFLARGYENLEGVDTMPTLVAVLDTNFWLSTHVTMVTLGYTAGLVACALGHAYVFARMFGIRPDRPQFYREVARMLYGVLCFGLFFATIGTILGGIWANESWGRFWGWDPKENGALMIVLWFLAILHGRMGGYVRSFGIAVASMVGGLVVVFSWWGVNQLEVGLHSYGFTDGVAKPLYIYYGVQSFLVLVAIGWAFVARARGIRLTP